MSLNSDIHTKMKRAHTHTHRNPYVCVWTYKGFYGLHTSRRMSSSSVDEGRLSLRRLFPASLKSPSIAFCEETSRLAEPISIIHLLTQKQKWNEEERKRAHTLKHKNRTTSRSRKPTFSICCDGNALQFHNIYKRKQKNASSDTAKDDDVLDGVGVKEGSFAKCPACRAPCRTSSTPDFASLHQLLLILGFQIRGFTLTLAY